MIEFPCPECGFALEFGDEAAGTTVSCPECRARVAVPEAGLVPKAQAEALVREVAERHRANQTLRRLGNFRADHLVNAAGHFARDLWPGETPLALLDTSLMQNAKAGLLVTNRNLYSSHLPYAIPLEDIDEVVYERPSMLDILLLTFLAPFHLAVPYALFRGVKNLVEDLKYRLLVNGEVVYSGGTRLRPAFWRELLLALAAARREQSPDDTPRRLAEGRRWAITRGRTPVPVTCEQCGLEYLLGMGGSPQRPGEASSVADGGDVPVVESAEELAHLEELRQSRALVPCPGCGWCQRGMVARARRSRHAWMLTTGVLLVPVAAVLFLIAYMITLEQSLHPETTSPAALVPSWCAFGVITLLAFGLPLGKLILGLRWDPNRASGAVRRTLGRARAVRVPEDSLS
jgi:hypothetical protein